MERVYYIPLTELYKTLFIPREIPLDPLGALSVQSWLNVLEAFQLPVPTPPLINSLKYIYIEYLCISVRYNI